MYLQEILEGNRHDGLDRAALEIARLEFPDLDPSPYLDLLDEYADCIRRRPGPFIDTGPRFLFEELGFGGDENDYYNAHNSCLNHVLKSKRGIPITLALVLMEVGRRLGEDVRGISTPGHFLAEYRKGGFSVYIDAFHGGRFLSRAECVELAQSASGAVLSETDPVFAAAAPRTILVRMLNNLRSIYTKMRAHTKLLQVLDWMLLAGPGTAELLRQRATTLMEVRRYGAARRDLEHYLRIAGDRAPAEVRVQLAALGRLQARLN